MRGLFVFTTAAAFPVWADEPVGSMEGETHELETMLVVADPPPPEEDRLDATFPFMSIDRQVFDDEPSDLRINDIIKRMPGIYTGGAPGEDKDARLRGLDKEFTRTTVNGIPIPDGGEKRELNLDRMAASLVEEIEIIRLPSAEYEADGIAGRINIVTREIPLEETLEGSVAVLDQDSLSPQYKAVDLSYGRMMNDAFGFQFNFSRQELPVDKEKEKFDAAGLLSEEEHENKPTLYTDFQADLGLFGDDWELHVQPMFLGSQEDKNKEKDKYKAGVFNGSEFELEDVSKDSFLLTFTFEQEFDSGLLWSSETGYVTTTEDKDKEKRVFNAAGVENTNNFETENEHKTDSFVFLKSDLGVPFFFAGFDNLTTFGFSLRDRDRDRDKTKTKGGLPQAANPKDFYTLDEFYSAVFVQNEMVFGDVTITPGLRVENVDQETTSGTGQTDNADFLDPLPSLPFAWRVSEDMVVLGGVGRLVNRPKFDELAPFEEVKGTEVVRGNPDLAPSYAWAYEVGVNYVSDPLFLSANVFYRDIEGVIETRATGETVGGLPVMMVQNVGDGYLQGIELEQRLSLATFETGLLDGFTLSANETFIESRLTDANGLSQPFKDQPDYLFNIILDWESPDLTTTASFVLRHVDGLEQSNYGFEDRPSETFIDLRLSQQLVPGVDAFFMATNITDQGRTKYKADGTTEIEETGPTYLLGLSATF